MAKPSGATKGDNVELSEFRTTIERDARHIEELSHGDLSLAVPTCPEWNLADLVDHMSRVYTMVFQALEGSGAPRDMAPRPEGVAVAAWYSERINKLLTALDSVDPSAESWNWSVGPQVASFWWRRMAQETAVHRWDAESAFGASTPIDPELASDGIDEWFDVHLRSDLSELEGDRPSPGTFHVHCSDVAGEWWAQITESDLELVREHRKGDVVARGSASDLLMVLWRRLPESAVEVLGDSTQLAAWLAIPDI